MALNKKMILYYIIIPQHYLNDISVYSLYSND